MRHMGRSHDAYKGQVVSARGAAADFARNYGFQLSARYNVDLYGEAGALELAQTWVAKAQHFYDIWSQQANLVYAFTAEDWASWQPGSDFLALLDTLPARAQSRVRDLRDLCPSYR